MKITHCDLCKKEFSQACAPYCELTLSSSASPNDEARLKLVFKVESLISKKNLGVSKEDFAYIQSVPELQKEWEGYDICAECWTKILKVLNIGIIQL